MREKFEHLVDKYAKEYGVDPALVKALIEQESGWNPNAVSKGAGAQGLGQLMPKTAAELGVTDSFDPEQNIKGTVKYIKKMLDTFEGDKKKALTAYHSGARNVREGNIGPVGASYYDNVSKRVANYSKELSDDEFLNYSSGEKLSDEEFLSGKGIPDDEFLGWKSGEPTWGEAYEQALRNYSGALVRGGGAIGSGIAGMLGADSAAESIAGAGEQIYKNQQGKVISNEDWENLPLSKKIGANIAAGATVAVPTMVGGALLGAATPVATGLGALGAAAAGLMAKDTGSSNLESVGIGAVQGLATAAGLKLPMGAQSLTGALGAAAANPLIGAAADLASQKITSSPETREVFDPLDPTARGTELGMGLGGATAYKVLNPRTKTLDMPPEKLPPAPPEYFPEGDISGKYDNLGRYQSDWEGAIRRRDFGVDRNGMPIDLRQTEEIRRTVEVEPTEQEVMMKANALGVGFEEARQYIKNGYYDDPKVLEGPPQIVRLGTDTADSINVPRRTTVSEMAAILAKEVESKNKFKENPFFQFRNLVLEKIMARVGDTKVIVDDHPELKGKPAIYDTSSDVIILNPRRYPPNRAMEGLAHEAIHALLSRELLSSPDGPYAKALKFIYGRTINQLDIYRDSGRDVQGKHSQFPHGHYGLKNIHEMASEIVNPGFSLILKNIRLSDAERRTFYETLHGKPMPKSAINSLKTAWNAITEAVGKLFNIPPKEFTALQAVMDTISKMGESATDFRNSVINWNAVSSSFHNLPPFEAPSNRYRKNRPVQAQKQADMYELDRRSFDEVLRDTPIPIRDIKTDVGTGVTTISWKLKKALVDTSERSNPAMIFLKWGMDQIGVVNMRKHARFVNANPLLIELRDALRGNFEKPKDIPRVLERNRKLINSALQIERDYLSWFNGKNYWPTSRLLATKYKMDASDIRAYRAIQELEDLKWYMLEATYKISGRKLPERIPGHISHFWEGSFKVVLKDDLGISHVFKFDSLRQANKILPTIENLAKQYNLTFETRNNEKIHHPDYNPVGNGELLSTIELLSDQFRSMEGRDPQRWSKILQAVDSKTREDVISEQFERLKRPVRGHELDVFSQGNLKNLSNKDFIKMMADRFEKVNSLLASVEVIHQVWKPLVESGSLNRATTPKAFRIFDDQVTQFVGLDKNALKLLDSTVSKFLGEVLRVDPNMARVVGSNISGLASVFYLTSAKFVYATLVQPFRAISQAKLFDAWLEEINHPLANKGSVLTSWAKVTAKGLTPQRLLDSFYALKDITDVNKIKDTAVRDAVLSGGVTPAMMDDLFPNTGIFSMMIFPRKLEMMGRLHVFLVMKDYAESKGFKGRKLVDLSKDLTDATMVPYSEGYGRPTHFSHFGVLGKAMTTFLTYTGHEMGGIYTTAKALKKFKSPRAKMQAAKSLIAAHGLQVFLAGIGGAPFVGNFDDIVELVNDLFGADLPNTKTAVLSMVNKDFIKEEGLREFVQNVLGWGAFNYVLPNVGEKIPAATGSMSGIAFMAPFAVPQMIYGMSQLATLGAKELFSTKPPSREAWKGATHSMPWFVKYPAEYALKNKNISDAYKQFIGQSEVPDVPTDRKNVPIRIPYFRDNSDRSSLLVHNSRTIDEEKVQLVIRNILTRVKRDDLKTTEWLQLLKEDIIYQNLTAKQRERVFKEISERYEVNAPEKIREYMKKQVPYDKFLEQYRRDPRRYEIYRKALEELEMDEE